MSVAVAVMFWGPGNKAKTAEYLLLKTVKCAMHYFDNLLMTEL